ncbi:Transmembrane protein 62 [Portunus trituberculatus]|uniref:Transmembrane protein 62 n=1 Tax=Portunus trituberculatus TaxID=210409 RepID=A0A5B7K603_PORTR|nr:Transmembrane protein 62 [Portunus trituberculatus]
MTYERKRHQTKEGERVLVWSLSSIVEARVRIGKGPWLTLTQVKEGPLFITSWNPQKYLAELHTLTVYARDSSGREQTIEQPFSLDGSQPSFRFWPRALLMSNVSMFVSLYIDTYFIIIIANFIV